MLISSRSNATIKQIRSLRERKERERTGLFFIEGIRAVTEAVQQGADIETFVVAPESLRSDLTCEILRLQRSQGARVIEVTQEVLDSLAVKFGFQGVGAVARQKWERLERIRPSEELCWVALDAVQYPGNLGTILRTGDAFGCAGVILVGTTADPYDAAAVRASAGAVFSQRLVRAGWEEFAIWRRRHNAVVVGTSPTAPTDYRAMAYRPPVVLFMGCERFGLPYQQQIACDAMVQIPMVGRCDSLNVAVATSVVLCEIFHQRRGNGMA